MEEMRLGRQNKAENIQLPAQSAIPELVFKRAEKLATYCRNYRSREIEADRFDTDAAARLESRKQKYATADPATLAADERNKLRRNNIVPVLTGFELLIDAIDKTHATGPLSKTIYSLSKELPDMDTFAGKNYESMSFEEKCALAERIDHVAQSFLDALQKTSLH